MSRAHTHTHTHTFLFIYLFTYLFIGFYLHIDYLKQPYLQVKL